MIAPFRLCILLILSLFSSLANAQTDHLTAVNSVRAPPRILLAPGQEKVIARTIAGDKMAQKMHQSILSECDKMLSLAPQERIKTGRRLLAVSREALRRLFFLSYAYRMSGDEKYSKRAEQEMLAVAAFSDWNPSHFLDVGEMTMAMAIGYDWLYDKLPQTSRDQIKAAIQQKGIDASLVQGQNSWLKVTNNWNQVCNAGMVYGAMAIYEDNPEQAKSIINRAINSVVLSMNEYAPDGAYPEGYSYWGYGTSFNVMLISALENLFGSSFGLAEQPGFLKTAAYLENMTGPSGLPFNYSDAGGRDELQPAMFWFAQRQKNPSLLWVERTRIGSDNLKEDLKNRLLPAMMLWLGNQNLSNITAPKATIWMGKGRNPVALIRTSWTDPNAIFVGIKGGSPSVSHAHMDAGTFVMESEGVRWAMDFGMQNYESLESKKVDLWNMRQNSQRWEVFRYNNLAHNTLTVNGQLQRVQGKATITGFSDMPNHMSASVDLSELYAGALTTANRNIAIINKESVRVHDEVETAAEPATVRWTMVTPATVKLVTPNVAELTKDGKTLLVRVDAPAQITLKTWPTDPVHDYDATNPGTTLLGFEVTVPAKTKATLTVQLMPATAAKANTKGLLVKPIPK
jgi:hypothetical protein